MGMLDDARRKVKDWTTSDENIQGSPKAKIKDLSEALPQLTPQERQRNIEHVKAYLDYYYVAHQGEKKIPLEVHKEFSKMVEQSNRLTAVENARVVLQQYGGAPSRETIENSLERSAHQRAKEFSQYRVEPITSREMSWRDLQPQQDRKQEQAQTQTQERTQTRTAEISHTPAPSSAPQARIELTPSVPPQTTAEPVKSVPQQTVMEPAKQPVQQVIAEPVKVAVEPAKSTQQTITEPTRSSQEMSRDEWRTKGKESIDQRLSRAESRHGTGSNEQFRENIAARVQPAVLLETYAAFAESIRHDRAQSQKLSQAIDGLSKEQIEKRIQQLEPMQAKLEAQEKAAHRAAGQTMAPRYDSAELRGLTRELGYLDNALHFKQQGLRHEPSWKDLHPKQEQAQTQKQGKSPEHKHEQKQSRSRGKGLEISA